jgi:predicted RNA binding protein YcfA (HicA-like mRNA interferase family)
VKVGEVLDYEKMAGFSSRQKAATGSLSMVLSQAALTVAGKPSDDLPPGTLNSIFKQAGWRKGTP